MSLSFDELKEKGNDSVRQKNYRDAVRYYTAALEVNPRSHVGYSNRSLAYSKLGLFKDALDDANKCTELDPSFARGHLRKSVALIHLNLTEEGMTAAENGYKLRGSVSICRDCVTQWLEANRLFHKELVDNCLGQSGPPEEVIPKGCRIISEDYLNVLLNTILCRLQPTTRGVKLEFMLAWMLTLLEELKRILQLFGHTLGEHAREWVESFSGLATGVDPLTSRVPTGVVELMLARANAFATWLDTSVDHILYPIVRPIMSLMVVAVGVRCISLNLINIDQPLTVVSCRACLPFFEIAPLTTAVYIQQRLCLCKELLEAFSQVTYAFNEAERQFGEKTVKSIESLIKQYPVDEFLTRICEKAIAIAQIRLRAIPGSDPVQYAVECGKVVSQIRKKKPENLKSYVVQRMDALKSVDIPFDISQGILLDSSEAKMMAFYEDMLELASCAGALVDSGEIVLATEALQLSEMCFLKYFNLQIARGAFGLDEAGIPFTGVRTAIMQGVVSFSGRNDRLVADFIIRWKCISSEFRAILIRLGIGKRYIKTFHTIQTAMLEGQLNQGGFMAITNQHKAEAQQFMKEKGTWVLSCLFHQSIREIESILQPGQLVLEYCVSQTPIDDDHPNCFLIALQAKSEVTVLTIDFKNVLLMVQKWVKALSDPNAEKEAESLAESVCKLLIPPPIEVLLNVAPRKQVFLCPDVPLNVLPLELIRFQDGQILGEKCTTTYLSSSRELLRKVVIMLNEMESASLTPCYSPMDGNDKKTQPISSDTTDLVNSTVPIITGPSDSADSANATGNIPADIIDSDYTTDTASANATDITSTSDPTCANYSTNAHQFTDSSTDANAPYGDNFLKANVCVIVAAPNFDLEKVATVDETDSGLWKSVIQGLVSLFSSNPAESGNTIPPLIGAEREATEVESILSKLVPSLKIQQLKNDNATLLAVLSLQSPLILHFSTHGFSNQDYQAYRSSFWNDTKSGLLLAGANTYRQGKLEQVAIEAGTGELSALAACGMSLEGTRLVYLSTCLSSFGIYSFNESLNSLAEAFRSAGAQTVIATLWPVFDDTAEHFSTYFYEALCTAGTTPSQALVLAKEKLRDRTSYKDWKYWSSFICIGEDNLVFSRV